MNNIEDDDKILMNVCEKCKQRFYPYDTSHTLCRSCYAEKRNLKICPDCGKMVRTKGYTYCDDCGLKRYQKGTLPNQ